MQTSHSPWDNPDRYVQRGDAEICYRMYGDKHNPAIVMIMGLSAGGTFWSPDLCELIASRGYFVITPDNRDTGRSASYPGWNTKFDLPFAYLRSLLGMSVKAPYTLEDLADDYVFLLEELGIENAHFVGVSLGGMIAQTIAQRNPSVVKSLILTNTCRGTHRDILPSFRYLWVCGFKRFSFKHIQDPIEQTSTYFSWLLHFLDNRKQPRDVEAIDHLVQFNILRNRTQDGGTRQSLAIIKSLPFSQILSDITAPTLVVAGKRDIVFPVKKVQRLAQHIPHSEFVVVEDMGHALMPSHYEDFTDMVVGYIGKVEKD